MVGASAPIVERGVLADGVARPGVGAVVVGLLMGQRGDRPLGDGDVQGLVGLVEALVDVVAVDPYVLTWRSYEPIEMNGNSGLVMTSD